MSLNPLFPITNLATRILPPTANATMGAQNKHRQTKKKRPASSMDEEPYKALDDPRFASVRSDPRFGKVSKHKSKVAIDSRFSSLITDKNFASSSAKLDKRGKVKKKDSRNALGRFYRIEEEREEGKEGGEGEEESEVPVKIDDESETDEESEEETGEGSEVEGDEESGSTTEEEVDGAEVLYEDGEPEVQEEDIPEIETETRRLAVVNMDWRHVKAVDLYVLLSSFLPKDGQILSVAVYPSDFGLQRMKEEEVHGPVGLFDDEENDDGSDDEIDDEKLRSYEKSRMRYYYAVVECDSIATADYLYRSCDGTEFERSANVLDLRFIPDSMEFKHPPREVATEAPANYSGLDFHSNALQQSKIHLSWDEDEPGQLKKLKRNLNDEQLAELELKEFLASDESESEEEEEDENATEDKSEKKNKKIEKYRALLESGGGSEGEDEEEGQDMEVTFNTGLEDISKRILEKKDKKSETVWEAYLRKKREKKKARKNKSKNSSEDESSDTDQEDREEPDDFFIDEPSVKKRKKEEKRKDEMEAQEASRAELELLVADEMGADTGIKGYNLKPKRAKGKKGKAAPDEDKIPVADLNDPRFSVLYTSPMFALDPTDPQFKRSAEYARQVAQRQQKERDRKGSTKVNVEQAELPLVDGLGNVTDLHNGSSHLPVKKDHELSALVRSVKMKSKQTDIHSSSKMSTKSNVLPSLDSDGKVEKHKLSDLVQSVKKKTKHLRK